MRYTFCVLLMSLISTQDGIAGDNFLIESMMTFVVNTIDDTDDGICDVTHCSFREAINLSNADGVLSEIHFDIGGTAPHIIVPGSSLLQFPEISEEIIIDATTQPNWALGDIVIDGSNANSNQAINANSATNAVRIEIYGLTITNFQAGVYAASGSIIGAINKANKFINNLTYHAYCIDNVSVLENEFFDTNISTIGVYMENGSNITVSENTFYNCDPAVFISNTGSGSITNNTIDNGNFGLHLIFAGSTNAFDVSGNTLTNLDTGLQIEDGKVNIDNNYITGCQIGFYILGLDISTFIDLNNNIIDNNFDGGYLEDDPYFGSNLHAINYGSSNVMTCNGTGITALGGVPSPIITSSTESTVSGTISTGFQKTIRLFLVDDSQCPGSYCQGSTFIGSTSTFNNNWTINVNVNLQADQRITAIADIDNYDYLYGVGGISTSDFSICHIVQPDVCETAKALSINLNDCATTGAVTDMELLTDSGQGTGSACDVSYAGGDAWYKIESPDTWNSLVRVNINNAINAIAEAYIGTCGNLTLVQCMELDSVPFAMILDDFTPGTEIYIRVWDRDNTVVNTGTGALLHFTAHELDTLKENWEICDIENNLINGNPTILSERDANKFIVEYEMGATQAEMQVIRDSIIANGGTKVDSFVCGPQVLELWDHDNPIDLETNRRRTTRRANVDTSNYNYVFEQLEFQLNAYADGEQYNSNVSMDSEGNFIVIWEDLERRNIFMRVYSSSGNPITKELRVGSQSSTQHNPKTELLENGNFITAWHEIPTGVAGTRYSIFARLWNSDGIPLGNSYDLSLLSSSTSTVDSIEAIASFGTNVSIGNNGIDEFIATWQSANLVFFQKLDQNGVLIDTLHQAAPLMMNGNNPNPKVSMNSSGNFVIAWNGMDVDRKGAFVQIYDTNLNPIGSEVAINTNEIGDQNNVDVVLADDGKFIATWQSFEQPGAGLDYDIYAQRFDSLGAKIGTEFLVNTHTADAQKNPKVALLDDGTFFITWDSFGQDGFEEGIFGQFYDNTGVTIGSEFQLNTLDDPEQENPSVATNGNSIVLVTWEDGINDGDGKGIFGQRYEIIDAGGQKVFYPIGTATPSTLLGDELTYPGTIYTPQDSLSNVRVAIIDTGVDPNHPYLADAMWNNQQAGAGCYPLDTLGYDFVNETYFPIDYDGHGTRVNGIIARDFPPDIQLELMNLKFHEFKKGKVFDAVSSIYYAVDNGADIINMSWGFEASEFPAILQKAVQYASDNDVLLVTTSGNTSKDNDVINKYPCNFNIANMIKVTSYESSNNVRKLANYASYGKSNVDIAAYGFVESPTLGDTLGLSSGTSLAAPQVTRTAAIIKGLFPNLTAADIKDCILSTSAPESDFTDKVATGGILDHDAAIDCAYDKAANCVAIDLYITLPQSLDTTFRSDAWITTDASYTSGSDVELYGAEHVTMTAGFETILGVEYLADIDDCDPLNSPLTQPGQNESSALRLRETSALAGKIKLQFYYSEKKVIIDLKDDSGKVIDTYTFQPEKEGWYEKIIDCKVLKSGVYQIELQGKEEDKESRYFQIYNQQYETYKNLSRSDDD